MTHDLSYPFQFALTTSQQEINLPRSKYSSVCKLVRSQTLLGVRISKTFTVAKVIEEIKRKPLSWPAIRPGGSAVCR